MLSDWRVTLLEAVDQSGSLAEAARQMQLPYRTAWRKIKELEGRWGQPLLVTSSGGAEGGRSSLTPQARELIRRFHLLAQDLHEQAAARFAALFAEYLP